MTEALSDDLRRQLAAIIAHPKMPADVRRFAGTDECDRCTGSLDVADAVIKAGFRLVSEDDATVDRVAEKLWREFWREVPGYGITKDFWRGPARAAVRALREAGQ